MTHFIVLDTETCGTLDCPFMFDFGFAVVDSLGNVLATRSLVISDYFLNEALMRDCYFAEKLPMYRNDIANGKRELVSLAQAKHIFARTCRLYDVKCVFAHNAFFDYKAMHNAERYRTCSASRWFLPYGVILCDTLKMARKVLKDNADYGTFCYENGYTTARGQRRYTAEVIYRWLVGDNDFVESHTALEDVLIEKEILAYCLRFMGAEDGRLFKE